MKKRTVLAVTLSGRGKKVRERAGKMFLDLRKAYETYYEGNQ